MRWDASRKVPWKRLVKPFLVYVGVAVAFLALFARDSLGVSSVVGLALGGLLYLGLAGVLVKLGWDPTRMNRRPSRATSGGDGAATTGKASGKAPTPSASAAAPRPKPAPTSRTATGHNRPKPKRR